MTHTSTEQPEALQLAKELRECEPSKLMELKAASALIALHARVQELEVQTAHMADLVELADYATKKLEASQAQRVPLDYHDIAMAHSHIGAHGQLPATERIVRWTEAAHGITQEKQG